MSYKYASIISRLDPNAVIEYICESERESKEATTFFLKNLTVAEYKKCEENFLDDDPNFGKSNLIALQYGLKGWDRFYWEDTNEPIPFEFKNINALPSHIREELSRVIIELAQVPSSLEKDLIFVSRWADYLNKSKNPEQWSCEVCISKKQNIARNCNGDIPNKCLSCGYKGFEEECPKCERKMQPFFKMRIGKPPLHIDVTRCPVSLLSMQAVKLTNLINYVENSNSLPFSGGAMEQTNFFYNVRMIVLSEQNALMKSEIENK